VLISHGDNDHIGGADSLLAEFKFARVLTSVSPLLSRYAPTTCRAGQSWLWDGVRFSILSPAAELLPSENDNSCVLFIQSEVLTALLPGDIEASAEKVLVAKYGEKLKADILVAPHHGSQTSSTPTFLTAVKPSHILIPSGYHNPFGHPHQVILQRYQNIGGQWLTSADEGAIAVNFDTAITLSSWRKTTGRYWNYHPDDQ
jgi:competence protein ComEC